MFFDGVIVILWLFVFLIEFFISFTNVLNELDYSLEVIVIDAVFDIAGDAVGVVVLEE